jgi:hypothetical protein
MLTLTDNESWQDEKKMENRDEGQLYQGKTASLIKSFGEQSNPIKVGFIMAFRIPKRLTRNLSTPSTTKWNGNKL